MTRAPITRCVGSVFVATLLTTLCVFSTPALAGGADPSGGTGGAALSGTLTVRVVEAGTTDPLAGAFVMVGSAEGDPFEGNVGVTDGSGEIVFQNPSLTGSVTVTAGDADRAYVSVFDLAVSEVVLPLPELAPPATARLGDAFNGIEVDNGFFCAGDGNLDLGFVFPAIPLDQALTGSLLDRFLSPTDEPISLPLGMTADVPSNVYAPAQCETFLNYSKTFYHTRQPLGRRTLYGLTIRGAVSEFLDLASAEELTIDIFIQLLSNVEFRELGLLRDLDVVADSDAVDLTADRPLTPNLTFDISNTFGSTSVIAAAGGRLPTPGGGEELLITGLTGFDPDVDGPTASLTTSTAAAAGPLFDMTPGALVALLQDEETEKSGSSLALIRSGFAPPDTLTFDSFYDIPAVSNLGGSTFSWSNVVTATSPASREVNRSSVVYEEPVPNPDDPMAEITRTETYWIAYSAGSREHLTLPTLPPIAPTALPIPGATMSQDQLTFSTEVYHLGDDPGFDFSDFALSDLADFATHVASGTVPLSCDSVSEVSGLRLTRGPGSGELTLSWDASLDTCHDALGTRGYEIYAGDDVVPLVDPGAWPDDPTFLNVTDEDLDGSLADESFTHAPPLGATFYLVTDRSSSGSEGPVGHYPSAAP